MNGGGTMMHSLGSRRSCVVDSRGNEVHREAETKEGGQKRWRRQRGEAGSMEDDIRH